jgi:hypothetical protein
MSALPPSFPGNGPHEAAHDGAGIAVLRWHALVEAGNLVAALAGENPAPADVNGRSFENLLAEAPDWRRERAEHALADLTAIMEPGIVALLAIHAQGTDPNPAARALWREFEAARGAVLALLAPAEVIVPE